MQGVPDDEHHIGHITQLLFPDFRSQFSRHLVILSIRTENLVTRMTILYLHQWKHYPPHPIHILKSKDRDNTFRPTIFFPT